MQLYFGQNNVLMMALFLTNKQLFTFTRLLDELTDWLESCGLLVDYCDVFISCLGSHSDGTHSLQRIHWWASDVMPNLFWWRNKLIYISNGLRLSTFSANFHFWGWSVLLMSFFHMFFTRLSYCFSILDFAIFFFSLYKFTGWWLFCDWGAPLIPANQHKYN